MGKHNSIPFLPKLKLILYTLSFTYYQQQENKQEQVFLKIVNNVEGLGMRKTFYLFFNNMLCISCGEVFLIRPCSDTVKKNDNTKTICSPDRHIKKEINPGFSTEKPYY